MSALTLTLVDERVSALDLSGIEPGALAGLSLAAIRRRQVTHGRRSVALADLFDISGDDPSTLRLLGLTAACHRVGFRMQSGSIEISGAVGDELGRELRGGNIRLHGQAGVGVGLGMAGGHIFIDGSAGAYVGGVVAGAVRGMNGGVIVITRHAGERCGERMRRGFIAIGGDTGAHTGDRMIAGTIAVLGRCGVNAGFGMRRGSLLLAQTPAAIPPTFTDCGEFELGIMPLIARYLADYHRPFARRLAQFKRARRWCGDMAYGGKGEMFIASCT